MKELFEVLLKLKCTEVHLKMGDYRVTFISGDKFLYVTLKHHTVAGLTDALKNYVEVSK